MKRKRDSVEQSVAAVKRHELRVSAADRGADVLSLEEAVWWPGGFRGSGTETASGGEPQRLVAELSLD